MEIYDANGTKVVTYTYDAWGNVTVSSDTSGYDIGNINPIRYRSYYYDVTSKLYYLQTRYYDPAVGRFLNADSTLNLGANGDVLSYNLYLYCSNNPVNFVDPTGCSPFWDKIWAGVTFILSAGAIIAGGILVSSGVGAPLGSILLTAGISGVIGWGGSAISQGVSNSWGNINWRKVAFNSGISMVAGALMASPLSALTTGFAVGSLGFTQSVGNDLIDNGGDWDRVSWGRASILGVLSGFIAGGGKYLTNNSALMNKFVNSSSDVKTLGALLLRLGLAGRGTYVNYWMNVMIAQTIYRTGTSVGMNLLRSGSRVLINFLW